MDTQRIELGLLVAAETVGIDQLQNADSAFFRFRRWLMPEQRRQSSFADSGKCDGTARGSRCEGYL